MANKRIMKKRRNGYRGPLEDIIDKLAASGELAKPAQAAIRRQLLQRIPVTFKRGSQVIRIHPDGREEVLTTLPATSHRLPEGVAVIGGR